MAIVTNPTIAVGGDVATIVPIAVVCALTKFRQILLRGTFRYLESRCDFSVESCLRQNGIPSPILAEQRVQLE